MNDDYATLSITITSTCHEAAVWGHTCISRKFGISGYIEMGIDTMLMDA